MEEQEKFMREALKQAKKAYKIGEVPIGCVIVQDGKIIARGYNRRNTDKVTLAHAEIAAIKKASKKTGDWRLEDCTMYVTLEPCQMCAGAIVQSRSPGCPSSFSITVFHGVVNSCFAFLLRTRSSLKKRLNISEHASSNTPRSSST